MVQRWKNDHGFQYQTWIVQGTDQDGERIRKQFKDQYEAQNYKTDLELRFGGIQNRVRTLQTTLTIEQLQECEAALKRLSPRYTVTQAIDYFFQHFREADFKISLERAILKFRGHIEGQIRERSQEQLKSTLGQFERFTENPPVHEVTSEDVERFLKSLRARDGVNKASPKTWNNYRADLHLFFEWCADKGQRYVATNPVVDTNRMQVQNGHIETLELEQARKLMNHVAEFKVGKYVRYFGIALFGGVRPGGELEKLAKHPELINLSNRVIRITPEIAKTGKARQVKIRENLYQWLTKYPGEILPVNSDRQLKAIRGTFALGHDVLRHTFISALVMAEGSFAEAAIESGNSEKIIRDHYFNATTKEDALAFWQILPVGAGGNIIHLPKAAVAS